jgi:hypothetical protein
MDPHRPRDADMWQVPAFRHLIDGRAADAELLRHVADGQELLREHRHHEGYGIVGWRFGGT